MTTKPNSTRTSSQQPTAPTTSPSEGSAPRPASGKGETKRPDIVFGLWTDRTTKIEVAVWSNEVQFEGKVQTRYACTIGRSYRTDADANAEWVENTTFRTHDVPALCFLLERAHNWMLAQRMDTRMPF